MSSKAYLKLLKALPDKSVKGSVSEKYAHLINKDKVEQLGMFKEDDEEDDDEEDGDDEDHEEDDEDEDEDQEEEDEDEDISKAHESQDMNDVFDDEDEGGGDSSCSGSKGKGSKHDQQHSANNKDSYT